MNNINLFSMDRQGWADYFHAKGQKPFRAKQILQWVYQRGVTDLSSMTDISKALRTAMAKDLTAQLPQIVQDYLSADGTRKWLLRLHDGNSIEMVFIPEPNRRTLCISSQVGCALRCSFCHTAQQGFNRNLTVDEIIAQVWLANQKVAEAGGEPVTNVVFMGMGEPLLNFEAVVGAIGILLDDFAFGLSKRRITVSTSGVVPEIDRLREVHPVSLALSLHASNDVLRDQLVPINKKYPIASVLEACRRYTRIGSKRHVTFEYVMLDGINDSEKDAKALGRLLAPLPAKVNLIPFNLFPGSSYTCSSEKTIEMFKDTLQRFDLVTTVRRTRGDDIVAACGQLAGQVKKRQKKWLKAAATPNERPV